VNCFMMWHFSGVLNTILRVSLLSFSGVYISLFINLSIEVRCLSGLWKANLDCVLMEVWLPTKWIW
jgi:hypothetical protein